MAGAEVEEELSCPFCSYTCSANAGVMQLHVDLMHSDVLKTPPKSQANVFEESGTLARLVDDGSTCIAYLSDSLARYMQEKHARQHFVISPHASHFGADYLDSGWGCGYRNLQMMLASLNQLSTYQQVMAQFQDGIPSIRRLQELIERARACGFDAPGCNQLSGRLKGTRKWIGATEIFALLSSFQLHCRIIDFHKYSDVESRLHPALFDWFGDYFIPSNTNGQDMAFHCHKPIVYLQHEGHSRSVVGVKYSQSRVSHLILFDPSHRRSQLNLNETQLSNFFKPLGAFKKSQYQVVCVCGIASESRYEQQKNVNRMSEKIPPMR